MSAYSDVTFVFGNKKLAFICGLHINAFPLSSLRSHILLGLSSACSSMLNGDSSPHKFAAKHSATNGPELRPREPSPPNTYNPS
jgi:hypothetical protein